MHTHLAVRRVSEVGLLTPEEAGQVLGIGRTKVYELMLRNAIESVKIGASRRIPVQSVNAFVDTLRGERV